MGKIVDRVKRERAIISLSRRGYSRRTANAFYKKAKRDLLSDNGISLAEKRWAHERGYLSKSIEAYDLKNNPDKYISDLDLDYLKPFNNSFSKWFGDLVTVSRVLGGYQYYLPRVRFNIMVREGKKVFLPIDVGGVELKGGYDAFIALLEERGALVLGPSNRWSRRSSFLLSRVDAGAYSFDKDDFGVMRRLIYGGAYDKERVLNKCGAQTVYGKDELYELIQSFEYDWVAYEPYVARRGFEGMIKLYVASKGLANAEVLDAYHVVERRGRIQYVRLEDAKCASAEELSALYEKVSQIASFVSEVQFLAVYVVLTEDGFVIDSFDTNPSIAPMAPSDALNDYLLERLAGKRRSCGREKGAYWAELKKGAFDKWVKKCCRPGMRPYMQKLWMRSVWDDLVHTKTTKLSEKLWAWRRGFLSFRIAQYGLNEENYSTILSDYQYHWLNRINNGYQIWINDKITTRYVLEPYKQYLARYYYEFVKQDGVTCIKTLQDIPTGFEASWAGLRSLLEREKLLALKPSAGTHGDGFYRLEYCDGGLFVNGQRTSWEDLVSLIEGFSSFYVVTEYLFIHKGLRDIYPNALNTIRVAVVNQDGQHPAIMQSYMRVGSSSSGYTDNVGYGGICANVRIDDGYCYNPEKLQNHSYLSCPTHPDTGAVIERYIPNWDIVRKGVLDLCSFMPQLEYLGFDIAVTDDGFKILEINIHQDLHKVAEHSEEFRRFYQDKLRLKAHQYGLETW